MPKLKKLLKKALIKISIENKDFFFVLENAQNIDEDVQILSFHSNLISSNITEIGKSFNFQSTVLKLPLILKVFREFKDLNNKLSSLKRKIELPMIVSIKINNLMLKRRTYFTFFQKTEKILAVQIKILLSYPILAFQCYRNLKKLNVKNYERILILYLLDLKSDYKVSKIAFNY